MSTEGETPIVNEELMCPSCGEVYEYDTSDGDDSAMCECECGFEYSVLEGRIEYAHFQADNELEEEE